MAVEDEKFIGKVSFFSGNANIVSPIFAFKDNKLFQLSQDECESKFTGIGRGAGRIFSPSFHAKFPNISDGDFVQFKVTKNKKQNNVLEPSDYITVDTTVKLYKFKRVFYSEALHSEYISSDDFAIPQIAELEKGSKFYIGKNSENFVVGDFVYEGDGTYRAAQGTEVTLYRNASKAIIEIDGRDYYTETLESDERYDAMTQKQLADWFKKQLSILSDITKDKAKELWKTLTDLQSVKPLADDTFLRNKIVHLQDNLVKFEFAEENIRKILNSDSPLVQAFKDAVEPIKQNLRDSLAPELKQTQSELDTLKKAVEADKKEETKLQESIEKLKDKEKSVKKEFDEINSKKESLIADIRLKAQIFNASGAVEKPTENTAPSFNIEHFKRYDNPKNAENTVQYGFGDFEEAAAVFIPSIEWAYRYAEAKGNAIVFVLHVEHDWVHYDDFCKHGLLDMWKYAHEHSDEQVILVLDCMNLTFVEGGLKPLLDVIAYRELDLYLQGTNLGLPPNLKICATIVPANEDTAEKVGLRLNPGLFKNWGAFLTPDGTLKEDKEERKRAYYEF